MQEAYWLPNGNILAPVAVSTVVDGEVIQADGRAEVERGSDLWEQWRPYVAGDPPSQDTSEATRPHSTTEGTG